MIDRLKADTEMSAILHAVQARLGTAESIDEYRIILRQLRDAALVCNRLIYAMAQEKTV